MFEKKTLLITGGTGSLGKATLHRFIKSEKFQEIRIFSRDEKKQDDLRNLLKNPIKESQSEILLGDIRDKNSIESAMVGVDCVFHAAALKQVPTGEFFPWEVIKTNTLGALNIID